MGVLDDIDTTFRSAYAAQLSEWERWINSTTKHGCFCGAGSVCHDAIDGLDSCCRQHDVDYSAVGHSAATMWTVEGLIATRHADAALASCAERAQLAAPGAPHAHEDPPTYRHYLVEGFRYRAWVGEQLHALQERRRAAEETLKRLRDLFAASESEIHPDTVVAARNEVSRLHALECTQEEIELHLHQAGVDVAQVREALG